MRKPIIITLYGSYVKFEGQLKEIGLNFTVRDVLWTFWCKEFTIEYPKGVGATRRLKQLDLLLNLI